MSLFRFGQSIMASDIRLQKAGMNPENANKIMARYREFADKIAREVAQKLPSPNCSDITKTIVLMSTLKKHLPEYNYNFSTTRLQKYGREKTNGKFGITASNGGIVCEGYAEILRNVGRRFNLTLPVIYAHHNTKGDGHARNLLVTRDSTGARIATVLDLTWLKGSKGFAHMFTSHGDYDKDLTRCTLDKEGNKITHFPAGATRVDWAGADLANAQIESAENANVIKNAKAIKPNQVLRKIAEDYKGISCLGEMLTPLNDKSLSPQEQVAQCTDIVNRAKQEGVVCVDILQYTKETLEKASRSLEPIEKRIASLKSTLEDAYKNFVFPEGSSAYFKALDTLGKITRAHGVEYRVKGCYTPGQYYMYNDEQAMRAKLDAFEEKLNRTLDHYRQNPEKSQPISDVEAPNPLEGMSERVIEIAVDRNKDIITAPEGVYKPVKGNVGVLTASAKGGVEFRDAKSGEILATGERAVVNQNTVHICKGNKSVLSFNVKDYAEPNQHYKFYTNQPMKSAYKAVLQSGRMRITANFQQIAQHIQRQQPKLGLA